MATPAFLSFSIKVNGDVNEPARTRVSHKKSRGGCGNCKTRRVKCDETQPTCLRCQSRHTECRYPRPLLADRQKPLPIVPCDKPYIQHLSNRSIEASMISESLAASSPRSCSQAQASPRFTEFDLAVLSHYQAHTARTIGDLTAQQVYASVVVNSAVQNEHLMNAILAVSDLHQRYLRNKDKLAPTSESQYWQRTITTYRGRLASPLTNQDASSMLATATFINGLAFAMVDTKTPEQAWPCRSRDSDLWWLKLQSGLRAVFAEVATLPSDGQFRTWFETYPNTPSASDADSVNRERIQGLMATLHMLCSAADDHSTMHSALVYSQTYTPTLASLEATLRLPPTLSNMFKMLDFVSSMQRSFVALLEQKDHRALLLMCIWYGKLALIPCWWTEGRAKVEHRSISIYLEKYARPAMRSVLRNVRQMMCIDRSRDTNVQGVQQLEMADVCRAM